MIVDPDVPLVPGLIEVLSRMSDNLACTPSPRVASGPAQIITIKDPLGPPLEICKVPHAHSVIGNFNYVQIIDRHFFLCCNFFLKK